MGENNGLVQDKLISKLLLEITDMKQKKCRYKTAFTKTKNRLLKLMEEDLPSRRKVRQMQTKLDDCQEEVVAMTSSLAEKYKQSSDIDKWMITVEEINTAVNEQDMVHSIVDSYLRQRADKESSISTHITIISTLERRMQDVMFEEYQEVNGGMEHIQSLFNSDSSHRSMMRIVNLKEFGQAKVGSKSDDGRDIT